VRERSGVLGGLYKRPGECRGGGNSRTGGVKALTPLKAGGG
jgi:hypothetical protein